MADHGRTPGVKLLAQGSMEDQLEPLHSTPMKTEIWSLVFSVLVFNACVQCLFSVLVFSACVQCLRALIHGCFSSDHCAQSS